MKVNPHPQYNIYTGRKTDAPVSAFGGLQAGASLKTDTDSIARGATALTDKQLLLMKSEVQSYVAAPAGTARLDSIRQSVQNGTYHIPTDALVSAIAYDD
ncbi:hypothetical protein LJC63_01485 [Ruminococcaceae bacterium OttesenSCG-928-L11]|nr:hypothetical protein [Ruminococcaceae bacterium OttesenSCG-928-L11]